MQDTQVQISEYRKLASKTEQMLRETAETLERGELPAPDTAERVRRMMKELEDARGHLERAAENMGVSSADTIEDLERQCGQSALDELLLPLDAIQTVAASEGKYSDALKELQDRAAQAAQSLRAIGGAPSEESRHAADQALAVLSVLDGQPDDDANSRENDFERLGISDTILLGLVLGKYSRNESGRVSEENTAAMGDVHGEKTAATVASEEGSRDAGAETLAAARTDAVGGIGDLLVRPLSKLQNHKPNAKRFMNIVKSIGRAAVIAVINTYCYDVVTVDQVVQRMRNAAPRRLPRKIRAQLENALHELVRRGILAAYRAAGMTIYVFTRFGLESMQKPEVLRLLGAGDKMFDDGPPLVAQDTMSETQLIRPWVRNELYVRLDAWIRKHTDDPHNWDWDLDLDGKCGIALPKEYGRGDEVFLVAPYNAPRRESPYPIFYVSVLDDAARVENDTESQEGWLLLLDGELYERRDGAWIKMRSPVKDVPSMPKPAVRRKRK